MPQLHMSKKLKMKASMQHTSFSNEKHFTELYCFHWPLHAFIEVCVLTSVNCHKRVNKIKKANARSCI